MCDHQKTSSSIMLDHFWRICEKLSYKRLPYLYSLKTTVIYKMVSTIDAGIPGQTVSEIVSINRMSSVDWIIRDRNSKINFVCKLTLHTHIVWKIIDFLRRTRERDNNKMSKERRREEQSCKLIKIFVLI